jgi:putative ABC transport system ATP-binding protein
MEKLICRSTSKVFSEHDLLRLENISYIYTKKNCPVHALRAISLSIEKGEFIGLSGESGSGKTTLLNILGLTEEPSEGTIYLLGEEIPLNNEKNRSLLRRTKIGYLFQNFHLFPNLSVLENVMMTSLLNRASFDEAKARAITLLERVGLRHRITHQVHEISGGEMQRAALCRAVIHSPLLLLADEPTGNLDSTSGKNVLELLKELNTDGYTIVMATHSKEALKFCSRIITLKDGSCE